MNTVSEIKELAKQTAEQMTAPEREQQNLIKSIMDEIEQINPQLGGFDELAMVLSLPDEEFNLISPIFLDEFNRSLNNTADKLLLVQSMNASGVKVEDMQEQYLAIMDSIDTAMADIEPNRRDFLKQLLSIIYNMISDTEGVAKKIINIPIEFINEVAKLPTYAHLSDSGMDVYATEDIEILPGETKLIPLGFKVAIPPGYELQVRPKSGRSLNTKLRIANAPGTIDAGFRDEVAVIVENIDPPIRDIQYRLVKGESDPAPDHYEITSILFGSPINIGAGEKFAQLVLCEVPKANFYLVSKVSDIGENRGGGFGSTGLK